MKDNKFTKRMNDKGKLAWLIIEEREEYNV